tara:strand:- start:84 stop:629 length:546 start_codon:yes stop_codon:yes gene_type:complete
MRKREKIMKIDKNITKSLINNLDAIDIQIDKRFKLFKESMGSGYEKLSTKLKSEILSNLIEAAVEESINEVSAPTKDHMPDLLMNSKPLEIKTTAGTDSWRGGEFSKRPGDYIMVGWEEVLGVLKTFMVHTFLEESDWNSSGSDNYYATSITLTEILNNAPYEILKGGLNKKIVKTHMVKV